MNKKSALLALKQYLSRPEKILDAYINVPSLWQTPLASPEIQMVKSGEYFSKLVTDIISKAKSKTDYSLPVSLITESKAQWTKQAVIYNAFPRLTSAFDHDGNTAIGHSQIDITVNAKGIRDTGTFLKTIAMLPYIKSMGVNTLYLLPVNKIGKDGRNGTLGSPYATKDIFSFDKNLADPLLGAMPIEDQFKALVEAAHVMGIRVVMEFALRTASLDATWAEKHPDWFYWIDSQKTDQYASPYFAEQELQEIKKVPSGDGQYIAPSWEYRSMFCPVPQKSDIKKDKDKYIARIKDYTAVIPGAFADWPPDDVQPAWRDVTYLRMYNYPTAKDPQKTNEYNYIAYNTIRYYDPKLARAKNANTALWNTLCSVIPHYQKNYGIDGVMIDMGHAIPAMLVQNIIEKARDNDPTFAFFEENFYPSKKSKQVGYNAALGFGFEVGASTISRAIDYSIEAPIPIFGTLETHNTPRAASRGGERFSKMGYAVFSMLPSTVPFIHSGFELLETMPVNTGIGFTPAQSEFFRSLPLPLFYAGSYNWAKQDNIVRFISKINAFRAIHQSIICSAKSESISYPHIESADGKVICFERHSPRQASKKIVLIANTDLLSKQKFYLHLPQADSAKVEDVIDGFRHTFVGDWLSYEMDPGAVIIFVL